MVIALRARSHNWSLCKGYHWGSRDCTSKANKLPLPPSRTAVRGWRLLEKVFAPFLSHHQQHQQSEGAHFQELCGQISVLLLNRGWKTASLSPCPSLFLSLFCLLFY